MSIKKVVVGSRDSMLAIAQTKLVMNEIKRQNPDIHLELVTLKTTGDHILDKTLDKIGGKGLFVKELDEALLNKTVDITIHSLKDVPAQVDENLPLIAFFKRGNPFDTLVLSKNPDGKIKEMTIGSSSARRNIQLKELYGDSKRKSIRGNVITRLEKLDRGDYDALVLAGAGLERLNIEDRIYKIFTPEEMVPASGQGILVIQGRKDEDYSYLKGIDHINTRKEAEIERAFIRTLDGGCSSPVGAFSQITGDRVKIYGFYADEKTEKCRRGYLEGQLDEGVKLACDLARKLKEEVDHDR